MNNEINLAWMYPDILNLHGERGNIKAFKVICDRLDVKLNILRIDDIKQKIDFDNIDILLFNCGELKVIPTIVKQLNKDINKIKEYIHSNKAIIATGTSGAILAKSAKRYDNKTVNGLHLLNITCNERTTVIGDDILFELNDKTKIIGSQIQMLDIDILDEKPLGKIIYGYGNNGKQYEGVKKDNIIFTNTLGPVFVKNPWWTESIIRIVCKQKNISISNDIKLDYEIEQSSFETTNKFIQNKIKAHS